MPEVDELGYAWYFGVREWDGGAWVEMDLTPWGEQIYALLTTNETDSEMPITFPIETPLPFPIRVKREWWAGPRKPDTREWNGAKKLYGGYIEQQEGDTEGTEHIIKVTLSTYSFLPDTVDVLSWPGDVDSAPVSYPPDFSVAAWMVGRAGDSDIGGSVPYDGLIPGRLGSDGGIMLTGVDDVFYTIALPATALPAPQGTIGAFGKTDLRECLDDLVALIRYLVPGSNPEWHFDAVMDLDDNTRLRPRFRLTDRSAPGGGAVAHFSTNPVPDSGEVQIIRPSSHLLRGQNIRTRVVAMGETGDTTLPGNPLAYYIATNPDHLAAYPTCYHTDPGWSGKPYIDNRLDTRAKCQAAAEGLEEVLWGSEDTISFYTTIDYIARGDLITITDEVEAYDHTPFAVAQVVTEEREGALLYKIVIGLPSPNILEIIRDAARGVRRVRAAAQAVRGGGGQGDLTGAGYGSTGLPGTPRRVPLEVRPFHPLQPTIQPMFTDTPGVRIIPSTVDRPVDTVLDDPTPVVAARAFEVFPAGTDPNDLTAPPGTWATPADGRPHPQQFHLGAIAAADVSSGAGTIYLTTILDACTARRVLCKGTGSVQLLKEGVTATPALAATTGGVIYILDDPVEFDPLDDLDAVVSGVTTRLRVVVSE